MTHRFRTTSIVLAVLLTVGAAACASDASTENAVSALAENTLVAQVRNATKRFRDVEAAKAAGYGLFHGCVNGSGHGAMGIHFVNGDLVGDGEIDAAHPEAVMYEFRGGRFELIAVEYVVIADAWNAAHAAPPVLNGQLFTYNSSPNRYGIPAFYALHVWAWKNNPDGVFADWNPKISCAEYTGDVADHAAH